MQEGANVPAQLDAQETDIAESIEEGDVAGSDDQGESGVFTASHGLTARQKMAVLLVALGPERAKTIISTFPDEEIERIAYEIANMRVISAEQREAVIAEAYEYIFGEDAAIQARLMAGRGVAKDILNRSVGGVRARNILDRLDIPQTATFTFVGDNDLENLAYFLENQLPQIAAVTLLHLRAEHAHAVLEMLPGKLKAEVISRMVSIDKVDRQMVTMLQETLQEQLEISSELVNLHGKDGASSMLRQIPGISQEEVLEAIGETNESLKNTIERQLLTFDDLASMDDRDFALVINRVRSTDKELLPLALKSCSERMNTKIFGAMTSTVVDEVTYRLETMQKRRLSEVEEAQYRFVEIAKQMSDEGTIVFGGTEPLV